MMTERQFYRNLFILCLTILSEPISLTILFPFVYFMVVDFGFLENEVGYYVGLIASSFSLAQFCSAMWY